MTAENPYNGLETRQEPVALGDPGGSCRGGGKDLREYCGRSGRASRKESQQQNWMDKSLKRKEKERRRMEENGREWRKMATVSKFAYTVNGWWKHGGRVLNDINVD